MVAAVTGEEVDWYSNAHVSIRGDQVVNPHNSRYSCVGLFRICAFIQKS